MNSNGQNRNNTFAGDVLIDGDLTVTGTINGGGGGGGDVTNPMSSNLDAGNFNITNVNTLSTSALTTSGIYINCNGKNLSNLTSIQLSNGLSFTASVAPDENYVLTVGSGATFIEYKKAVFNPVEEDINANNHLISNISELTAGEEGIIKTGSLDLQENNIINVNTLDTDVITSSNSTVSFDGKGISNVGYIGSTNGGADTIILNGDIKSNNGNFIDGITNITGYGSGDVLQLNGDIKITTKLDLLSNNIDRVGTLDVNYIRSSINNIVRFSDEVQMLGILTVFDNIVLDYKSIFNVERITGTHATVDLNLDMIPATEGKAGQILARNPAFDPLLSGTHKLVWTNPASGTVTNPMTVSLEAGTFSIYNANRVECKNVNIMPSGSGLSCVNGSLAVPITWGLALKLSTAPFYQTFNTDYITPATNLGIVIDSKGPDGITDSKITLSSPNIILNNSTNLDPSLVSITGNLQIINGSGYIHGNNLIVRGRTAGNVPTDLTIEGITTAINSTTLNIISNTNNITGNLNNITGPTNFTGTVRTNFIDANTGSNISILQNLTLAVGKFLRTPQIFTDAVRSNINTDLIIAGLLPDNKTQTNMILASPQISLNNQFGTLTADTQVNITGNIVFNNPVTTPFIHGSNLIIRGRNTSAVATPITIEGTTTTINSSTLQIFSSLNNNISGPTNFTGTVQVNNIQNYSGTNLNLTATDVNISNHLNVLTNRSPSIGVRTTLFKTFGVMPSVNINTLTPIKLNSIIANQKGDNFIPPNAFTNGDKFIIIMNGILSTIGSGSLNIFLYVGSVQALAFSVINVGSSFLPCKITIETDCTVVGSTVTFVNGTALCSMERTNTSLRYSTSSASNVVDNTVFSNSIDIYVSQSATQTSAFLPTSYTIEQL